MSKQVLEVEVVAHVLESMIHCTHCQVFIDGSGVGPQVHQGDLNSYPPDWKEDWQHLSEVVLNIAERFAGKLVVKITDAQSPQALWKAFRHGVRKYPTFIVNGEKYYGFDEEQVSNLINRHLLQVS